MSSFHTQSRRALPNGVVVERLPVGHARGEWRLQWVRSGVSRAELGAGSSGGRVQFFAVQVPDTITEIRVEYAIGDASAGTETLVLSAAER